MNVVEKFANKTIKRAALIGNYKNFKKLEEYKKQLNEKEIKSEKYNLIYSYLNENYWNRDNIEIENDLFFIIDSFDSIKFLYSDIEALNKKKRKLYKKLDKLLSSLSKEQINSNIFLKNAKKIKKISKADSINILKQLRYKIMTNETDNVNIEFSSSRKLNNLIPKSVTQKIAVGKEYIDVLDDNHKYVYDDYNQVVSKLKQLVEKIYLLQILLQIFNIVEKDSSICLNSLDILYLENDIKIKCSFNVNDKKAFKQYVKKLLN